MRGSNAAMKMLPALGRTRPAAINATTCAARSSSHENDARSPSPSVSDTGATIVCPARAYDASRISSSAILRDRFQTRIRTLGAPDFMAFGPRTVVLNCNDVRGEIELAVTAEEGAAY